MEEDLIQLRRFLDENRRVLNWRGIEMEADVPKFCIKNFMYNNQQTAIRAHYPAIALVLKRVGYQ